MITTAAHPSVEAGELRRRARHLLELAVAIETSSAFGLTDIAGDDTWRGGRPVLCRNLLSSNGARARQAVDDLRWQAWWFRQRARQLDLLAALDARAAG